MLNRIKQFIFLTAEGFTFQPNSQASNPDIDNLQVVGFASGDSPENAFNKLMEENPYLQKTSFVEIFTMELASDEKTYFSLKEKMGCKNC